MRETGAICQIVVLTRKRCVLGASNILLIGNEKSARSFSDRSFFVDVRAACPCQNACFSRIWRAWPKFSAGCPQGRPAENFGLWADFSFLIKGAFASIGAIETVNVLFRFFLLLAKRTSLRDAGHVAPKCCTLQYLDTKARWAWCPVFANTSLINSK